MNEKLPIDVSKNPLDFQVLNGSPCPIQYSEGKPISKEQLDNEDSYPVNVVSLQRNMQILKQWVQFNDPFVVVGPEGCGKNLLIKTAFKELQATMKI